MTGQNFQDSRRETALRRIPPASNSKRSVAASESPHDYSVLAGEMRERINQIIDSLVDRFPPQDEPDFLAKFDAATFKEAVAARKLDERPSRDCWVYIRDERASSLSTDLDRSLRERLSNDPLGALRLTYSEKPLIHSVYQDVIHNLGDELARRPRACFVIAEFMRAVRKDPEIAANRCDYFGFQWNLVLEDAEYIRSFLGHPFEVRAAVAKLSGQVSPQDTASRIRELFDNGQRFMLRSLVEPLSRESDPEAIIRAFAEERGPENAGRSHYRQFMNSLRTVLGQALEVKKRRERAEGSAPITGDQLPLFPNLD